MRSTFFFAPKIYSRGQEHQCLPTSVITTSQFLGRLGGSGQVRVVINFCSNYHEASIGVNRIFRKFCNQLDPAHSILSCLPSGNTCTCTTSKCGNNERWGARRSHPMVSCTGLVTSSKYSQPEREARSTSGRYLGRPSKGCRKRDAVFDEEYSTAPRF